MQNKVFKDGIIFNEDCLKVMDGLIAKGVKVDAIITDPPYEQDNHGGGKTQKAKSGSKLKSDTDFISAGFNYDEIFSRMLKLCKIPNLLIFCSNSQISKIMSWFENQKLSTTLLTWRKTNPNPLCNGKHVSDLEFVVYVRGKGATWNNDMPTNLKYKCKSFPFVSPKNRLHPTEKPVKLIEEYLKLHTKENQLVMDCYAGSGTILVACQNLKRKFIGCEFNPEKSKMGGEYIEPDKYYKIAIKRLSENEKLLTNKK